MTTPSVYTNGQSSASRNRSAGGPLDRQEWARAFTRTLTCSSIARHLLIELSFWAGADGRCWPSQALLAKELHLTSRSVQRALGDLVDCGALAVEVSGKGSRSPNTYRLSGALSGWELSNAGDAGNDTQSHGLRHTVARVTTDSRREPCIEPYNEPYSLQVEKSDVENSEKIEVFDKIEKVTVKDSPAPDSTESTATPSRVNGEPGKARKPRKTTPKVKAEPSVSESFTAAMVEKYPDLDVPAEIDAALNHTAVLKYSDTQRYVQNWLRRSAEWAKERNGKPRSTRPQIKADWQKYDFFGESDGG